MSWHGEVDVEPFKESERPLECREKSWKNGFKRLAVGGWRRARSIVHRNTRTEATNEEGIICNAVYSSAGILWDGTVVPCCFDFNGAIPLGNVKEKDFLDIWNGPNMEELRRILGSKELAAKHPVCGPCRGL